MAGPNSLNVRFTVLLDQRLADAIRDAAENEFTKPSAYVREAVRERLKAEGIDLRKEVAA
jgi:metal-responsive CopG/Arc/MetJ family transcriptional regulator